MKDKMSAAEKQRYDKIKRLIAILSSESRVIDVLVENTPAKSFKTGGRITVDGEIIKIKNKTYETRQLQKITINTEGSMRIFDRYGKKLCGSLTLNSSSANVEQFCIWVRKYKVPVEVISGDGERAFQLLCLFLPSLVIVLIKIFF